MTYAAITTNIHQTFNIQLDFGTEVTFHLIIRSYHSADVTSLLIGPILHLDAFVDTGLFQDFQRTTATYAKNIGQSNLASFILRQIYTYNSYCHI